MEKDCGHHRSQAQHHVHKQNIPSTEESTFSEGDIIELTLNTRKLWGIYIGLHRLVYVSDVDRANEIRRSSLFSTNSKKGIVNIDKLEDLNANEDNCKKYNTISSHWNLFRRTQTPEKIVERALVEIGHKTSMSSLDFVLYCRYGNDTKFWLLTVFIPITAIAMCQERIQETVKFLLREHLMKFLLLVYFIFAFCLILSIVTYLWIQPAPDTKWTWVKWMSRKFKGPSQLYNIVKKDVVESKFLQGHAEVEEVDEEEPMEDEQRPEKRDKDEDTEGTLQTTNIDPNSTPTDSQEKNSEQVTQSLVMPGEMNMLKGYGTSRLHRHITNCKKNPGHPEFIPIESFSLEHLPKGYKDSDLYEIIKATADLTVRISVTMTSPHRPEFYPNTEIPYFLSELRGKKIHRTGTGMVSLVLKCTDEYKHRKYDCKTCPCDKCKASDKPSKVWWKIYVNTDAHVVVDDIEASHTTLRLFYDSQDSELVILKDKVRVEYVSIEEDWCLLSCVTCNENLGNKLEKMYNRYEYWKIKVKSKFRSTLDNPTFIVSHPHGCSKQVSVGTLVDQVAVNEHHLKKITYTTCTCPGSAGAPVTCLGLNNVFVHSGTLKSGLNYSGAFY